MTQIPSDDILESLNKLRRRESDKLKTVLELCNVEIHQKKAGPDHHRMKTMVKRSIEQNLQMTNFEASNGNYETSAVVAVSDTMWISVQNRHSRMKNASRTRSPRGRNPSGKMARLPCKDHLTGTCTNPFCEKWHPPEVLVLQVKNRCKFGDKCSYAHRQVDEQPCKKSKKNGDRVAVAILENTRQLGCVSQDLEPPKHSSILRESSNISKPIRCVQFTKSRVASRQHSRPKTIAWNILPR